ncbi:hypothetical protein GJ744_002399 [Endocarpon pusillum]|uniref:Uncharacterized protein n=1 Tax=Endocarpon pusillum TaxID=364733 RepID=A0A8H7AQ84_9EURO|nr:hypothetical protein GJ744_002399 [Endocarpon pusillum]
MSLVGKNTEPLREVLDNLRLPEVPNRSPAVVVYQNYIEGHFYNNPINFASCDSTLNLGDVERMSYGSQRLSSMHHENLPAVTPPPSEHDAADADRRGLSLISEAPPAYKIREYNWFTPGRYFKIWAREGDNVDIEIHNKEFILLDTKNIEGPGLLVRQHITEQCEGHKGSFNRTHVLLKNQHPSMPPSTAGAQSSRKVVFMDEEEDEVAENTFIELEHTYNIPFVKYKCIDHGALTPSSLKNLRRYYLGWLKYHWDME